MKNKDYISTAPIMELTELLGIKMRIADDDQRRKLIWSNWLEREHTDQSNEEIKRQLLNEELGPLMRGH